MFIKYENDTHEHDGYAYPHPVRRVHARYGGGELKIPSECGWEYKALKQFPELLQQLC